MPSIQDLNAFKNAVNQLGNEPEIASTKNEVLEDIQPGEEGVPLMPELLAAREARQNAAEAEPKIPAEDSHPLENDAELVAEALPLEVAAEPALEQDVYQMLNTGFDEVDNERLNADISVAETKDSLSGIQDEIPEEIEDAEEIAGPEPAFVEPSIAEEPAAGAKNPSVLEEIALLEKALSKQRSFDLINISEKESREKSEYDEFEIPHDDARDFLLQLGSYPIALKLAIEEEISENQLNEEIVETLVEMVNSGAKPKHVAHYFFSCTGKLIPLPKGQRYYGVSQAKLQDSFPQQFARLGLPLIRPLLVGLVLLALLFWLPFYYIYRPLQAYLYYQKGHAAIFRDDFRRAERYFTLATNGWPLWNEHFFVKGWPFKSWYLQYAEGYAARKDFAEATFKLRKALRHYPDYRQAWLQYITLLSQQMGEYEKAEEVIQQHNRSFGRDYDILILRGQNFLYWGNIDPTQYENARQVFAAIYSLEADLPLLHLLDYYVRIASHSKTQLEELTSFFMEAEPTELAVPPQFFARTMSKAADHFLATGKVQVARKLLANATQVKSDSMEIYRSYARYYHMIGESQKELEALNMAQFFLNYRDDTNTSSNLTEQLLLLKQRANFSARNDADLFKTSSVFNNFLHQLEKAENRHLHKDPAEMARTYAILGDFYYRNIPHSLSSISYYQKAIRFGFEDPYLSYRYGYQLYQQKNFEPAIAQFLQSQRQLNGNYKVQYALGNSLLQAGSYNSAQGVLEDVYSSIQEDLRTNLLLDPQHSQEARDQLFMLVRLANDLGISYYRETLQSPNVENQETAMAYLIQGMGYLDILGRESFVSLKLPPDLLFRPRLLSQKTIQLLEDSIPAQGLVPGSLPDRNFKQILENRLSAPVSNEQIQPYWVDILNPAGLQQTMDF